jgi:hypothetical protein
MVMFLSAFILPILFIPPILATIIKSQEMPTDRLDKDVRLMPTETRVLGFSKNEVFEALRDYYIRTGRRLPPDGADRLTLKQDTGVQIALSSPGDELATNFTENEVGAALVMFCIRKRIPIAKRAVKSLEVAGQILSLHLKIGS